MGRRRGFTLIELLVVVAIISILAGFVVSAAQVARKRGVIAKAKAAIAAVETAIGLYELDLGAFPPSGNINLVRALRDDPGSAEWNGPYMKFTEEDLKASGEFIDPWGNPYVYQQPGLHNAALFDLSSYGPNGKDESGAGDDLKNW